MGRPKKSPADKLTAVTQITGYTGIDITKNTMIAQFQRMKPRDQLDFLKRIGVGVSEYGAKQ